MKQYVIKDSKIRIFCWFLFLVAIGKFIRFTIMKVTLVDTGIGHQMLPYILNGIDKQGEAADVAISIYRAFNIFGLSTYVDVEIAISIVFNMFLLVMLLHVKQKLDLMQTVFLVLSIVVLNIFDFTLAKEPIQMLYFIAIYLTLSSVNLSVKLKNVLALGILVFSALTFRVYYFLAVLFSICCQILCTRGLINNKKITFFTIIKIILGLGLIYFLFLNVCKALSFSNYSELIRVRTRTSTAASDMRNILPVSNLILFTFDYLIMLLRMLFPIELLPLGIKYFPYVFYQIVITWFIIKSIISIKINRPEKNIALYIYLGFLFCSAAFEPDFGSWVRHEAVLFPVFLVITDVLDNNRRKIRLKM